MDQYAGMYKKSVEDPAGFWSEIASEFYWKEKWNPNEICKENLDVTKGRVNIEVSAKFPPLFFLYYNFLGHYCPAPFLKITKYIWRYFGF
jgi:Acetyl-coenzyme A synthetase N-terminus